MAHLPEEGKQYTAEYNALTEMTEDLCNALPIDDLLPKMISKRVIGFQDKAEIRGERTNRDKVELFISKLTGEMVAGENRRFYKFIDVMKESPKCDFLVNRMEGWISHYTARTSNAVGTSPSVPAGQRTSQQQMMSHQPMSPPAPQQPCPTELLDDEKRLELQKDVFTNCQQYIVQYLSPDDVMDTLRSKSLIGDSAYQQLCLSIKTTREKNRTIVDELVRGGPGVFEKFCTILKKNRRTKHIADHLEKEWRELLQSLPNDDEQPEYSPAVHTKAQLVTISPQQSVGTSQHAPVTITQQEEVDHNAATATYGYPVDNMKLMRKHVIPRICAEWETVAAYLEYTIAMKNMISRTNRGLPRECCTALLEDWVTTDNGVKPKTWEKLVEVLSEISSLAMVTKQIKQCLHQEGVLGDQRISQQQQQMASHQLISTAVHQQPLLTVPTIPPQVNVTTTSEQGEITAPGKQPVTQSHQCTDDLYPQEVTSPLSESEEGSMSSDESTSARINKGEFTTSPVAESPQGYWNVVGIKPNLPENVPSNICSAFIIYTKEENDPEGEQVLYLSDFLRHCGVDCNIDQYYRNSNITDWSHWVSHSMQYCIAQNGHIILVCSQTMYTLLEDTIDNVRVHMAAAHIDRLTLRNLLQKHTGRFLPLCIDGTSTSYIPPNLRGKAVYHFPFDKLPQNGTVQQIFDLPDFATVRRLIATLTGQQEIPMPNVTGPASGTQPVEQVPPQSVEPVPPPLVEPVSPKPKPVTDPRAVAMAFQQAVKQGVHEANQFKIVMLGAEGAGKTSTVHSLLDKEFLPHQPSTVGADTHTADICNTFTADRIFVCNWMTRKFQHHLDDISVRHKHEMKQNMTKTLSTQPLEQNNEQHNEVLESAEYDEDSKSAGLEVLNHEATPDGNIRIIIYDLGGQEVYYEVHYLFLASYDVVFLTFNASVSLDKPVVRRHRYTVFQEEYKTRETLTTYEVIEATLHTVYSHCGIDGNEKSLSPRNPTVIMIATHSCNLTEDEKRAITDTLFRRLPPKLSDHFPTSRSDAIHFIDNEKRDPETFNHLKAVAVKAAQYTLTEERPIIYLKFEEKILTQSQKKTEISKEKAFSIAAEAGLEHTDEALLAVLQYYTVRGILLYYPDVEALKETIFISPQWVSDLVTCVIKTHDYAEPRPPAELYNKCIRFDKFGLLEEELLDDMLKRSGYNKDIVLGLLEKFELTIEVDRGTKFENEPDAYVTPSSGRVFFVPSMLVHNKTQDYITPKSHIDNIVLYHFPDKFIPDTVFNHVLILVTKWCKVEGHHIRCVFNGVGVFDYSDGKQSFILKHCPYTHSIKCHVCVRKEEMHNKVLWQQRRDLLELIMCFINSVRCRYIPKATKSIAYVECPLYHDKECGPHIRLDKIKTKTLCNKVNDYISEDAYRLLLESTDKSVTGAATQLVTDVVPISQIKSNSKGKPKLDDLNKFVRPNVAKKWRDLGVELLSAVENGVGKLDIIRENYPRDVEACCTEMFKYWLENATDASWKKLVEALEVIEHKVLAKELREVSNHTRNSH